MTDVHVFVYTTSMEFAASAPESDVDADPVRALRRAVDRVATSDPSAMTDAELARDLVALRTEADRIEAVLAELTMAANRRGIGLEDGHQSTPAWLRWRTGQTLTEIRRAERLGQVAELLPDTGRAWRTGEITSHAVALIAQARIEGADDDLVATEPRFLEAARRGDHRSLRILAQHFANFARADGSAPQPVGGLSLAAVGDVTVVQGELHGTAAETVAHTLDVFTRPPSEHDSSTPMQRRAEALVRICEIALKFGTDAEGAKPSVAYVIRQSDTDGPGVAEGLFGAVLNPAERERVLCDCSISRVVLDARVDPSTSGDRHPPGRWRSARRSSSVTDVASGPGVRCPPDGPTSITSDLGNTAGRRRWRTVSCCVADITRSCTRIVIGPSRSSIRCSAPTDPMAPNCSAIACAGNRSSPRRSAPLGQSVAQARARSTARCQVARRVSTSSRSSAGMNDASSRQALAASAGVDQTPSAMPAR